MANSAEKFPRTVKEHTGIRIYPHSDQADSASSDRKESQQPSSSSPPPSPVKSLSPFQKGLLWGTTFSLTAAISALAGASLVLVSPFSVQIPPLLEKISVVFNSQQANTNGESDLIDALVPYDLVRPMTILIMGIDAVNTEQANSPDAFSGNVDTLLLMRFELQDKSIRLLSIPADSRLETSETNSFQITEINQDTGPAVTSRIISRSLNDVPVDRYIRLTPEGLGKIVEILGGIEVFVPREMVYQDTAQNLEINLAPGWQTLNGQQAAQFVRFRSELDGDIGRIQRQQVFLKALQQRLFSPAMIPRLPQILRDTYQYFDTNLTLEEIFALANFSRKVEPDNLRMVLLPGKLAENQHWLVTDERRNQIMQEYFDVPSYTPVPMQGVSPQMPIAIQNASTDPSLANRMVSYLKKQNFNNIYIIPASPQALRETEIVVQQGNLSGALALQGILGIGKIEASSTGDLNSMFTVRVGNDGKQLLSNDSFIENR